MGVSATKPLNLTAAEKDLIRKSWAVCVRNNTNFSVNIFYEVFKQIPGTLAMFEQFKGKRSPDEVRNLTGMKAHCLRVSAIMNAMILELDDPVVLVEMFRNIARTHYRLGNHIGKAHYDAFGKIFIQCVAAEVGSGFTDEIENAWIKAYDGVKDSLMSTKLELEG